MDALKNSMAVSKNGVFREVIENLVDQVESGVSLKEAFEHSGIFEPLFVASVAVGQQSGALAKFMSRLASYYERRLTAYIDSFVALVEPVAVLVLGAMVAFVVMAIMIPIFNINQLVR